MTQIIETPKTDLELVIPDGITSVETVEQLKAAAMPFFEKAKPICIKARELVVTDAGDKAGMKMAHAMRMTLKDIRVIADKTRKNLKEDSLRKTQAIDKIFNGFRDALNAHESYLLLQETYAERVEAERLAKLKTERDEKLFFLGVDPANYNTQTMTDDGFVACVAGIEAQRRAAAEAKERMEAERIAKEKADAEERERQRVENERLRAEAKKREAEIAVERERVRKEREAVEAVARKERDAADARMATECRARERAESELREKEDAEKRRRAKESAAAKRAAAAPDKKKLIVFAAEIKLLSAPELKDETARTIAENAIRQLALVAETIETKANEL